MSIKIGIIDYGVCNLNSVINSFNVLGFDTFVVNSSNEVFQCSHLILPGVGSFPKGMENIIKLEFLETIKLWAGSGKPILGICLGMQLFAKSGYEFVKTTGIEIIDGKVKKIKPNNTKTLIPHVGWNTIQEKKTSRLLKDIKNSDSFYFVHSFSYENLHADYVMGVTDYDGDLVSIIECENIFGVQFHPEKSQKPGLQLLKNFVLENSC